jgi:hypothetical protein
LEKSLGGRIFGYTQSSGSAALSTSGLLYLDCSVYLVGRILHISIFLVDEACVLMVRDINPPLEGIQFVFITATF